MWTRTSQPSAGHRPPPLPAPEGPAVMCSCASPHYRSCNVVYVTMHASALGDLLNATRVFLERFPGPSDTRMRPTDKTAYHGQGL